MVGRDCNPEPLHFVKQCDSFQAKPGSRSSAPAGLPIRASARSENLAAVAYFGSGCDIGFQ
jgi:hypothetical protein